MSFTSRIFKNLFAKCQQIPEHAQVFQDLLKWANKRVVTNHERLRRDCPVLQARF